MAAGHFVDARKLLEAVGLLKTRLEKAPGTNIYHYEINAPKTPKQFFADTLLFGMMIQALGEKVYDEDLENEYLEYEFRLSPDSLKEIKRNNKSTNNGSGNYTNYDTNSFRYDEKKKIYIYTSPLIRGKSYTVKSPDENLLGCNNISKNKCETNMGGND